LRTGPLGRREAHISRFIEGLPSGLLRPAVTDPLSRERVISRRARPAGLRNSTRNSLSDSPSLNFKCALPINLREFLAQQIASKQFADGLRIDEDGVFTLGSNADEDALSRVARAIRRYSTERAHERWDECARTLASLGDDLDWAHESGDQVVLCIGCAALDYGLEGAVRHRGTGCVAIELSATLNGRLNANPETASQVEEPRGLPELLRQVIEGFRLGRAALGLSHYDLDCYVARGQVIFTWRPLSN
jgi:hypothetical protein